jgi:hypothetical protein
MSVLEQGARALVHVTGAMLAMRRAQARLQGHRREPEPQRYLRSTRDQGGQFRLYWSIWGRGCEIPRYLGSEGELYDLRDDPHQWHNRFDDPAQRKRRDDLLADLSGHLPPSHPVALPVAAPT